MQGKVMWIVLLGVALVLWAQAPALAQHDDADDGAAVVEEEVDTAVQEDDEEADDEQADESRDARRGPPAEVKERMGRPSRTMRLDRLERMMKKKLELDSDQEYDLEQLFEERRETYQEEIEESRGDRDAQREMMRDVIEQMREARDSGDEQRMQDLRESMRDMRSGQKVDEITDEFVEEVEELLDEEQAEQFHELLSRLEPGTMRADTARKNPQLFYRHVKRLDLDDEQREELEGLFEGVKEELRDRGSDPEDRDEISARFHEEVMELLSDEQKTQLKRLGRDLKRTEMPRPSRPQAPRAEPGEEDEAEEDDAEEDEEEEEEYD